MLFLLINYFLLRSEFVEVKKNNINTKKVKFSILISLSGINIKDKIELIINAINRFKEYKINIFVTGKIDYKNNSFHKIKNKEVSNSIAEIQKQIL